MRNSSLSGIELTPCGTFYPIAAFLRRNVDYGSSWTRMLCNIIYHLAVARLATRGSLFEGHR
jgi:hypothetical protein